VLDALMKRGGWIPCFKRNCQVFSGLSMGPVHISCQAQETLLDYDVFHGLMLFSMLGPYFLYRR